MLQVMADCLSALVALCGAGKEAETEGEGLEPSVPTIRRKIGHQ